MKTNSGDSDPWYCLRAPSSVFEFGSRHAGAETTVKILY